MDNQRILIRDLKFSDILEAMKLVLDEGWNQTDKDWKLFLKHKGNSCKCAETEGKLVGTTTSYNFENKVAWISMVLVHKDFRGHGISKKLLNSTLNELNSCENIKLDATEAGRKVYQKLGFLDEYTITRMVNSSLNLPTLSGPEIPVEIVKSDIANVIEFDRNVFGAFRPQLIQSWITGFPDKCRVLKRNNNMEGFVLGRVGNRFHQIGPVSARKLNDAKFLILSALKNLIEKPVVIDVMNDKPELIQWLTSIGFEEKREFTRMYLKRNSFPGNKTNQYIIGGPEFG